MHAVPAAVQVSGPPTLILPQTARFAARKRWHGLVARTLARDTDLVEMARSIHSCADALQVALTLPADADPELLLRGYNPCNRRACPMCEWRRSRVWRARLLEGLPRFAEAHPKHSALFLTLTVRNCRVSELSETIKAMHRAWQRMTKLSIFPSPYWLRRTEVTLGEPAPADGLPQAPRRRKPPAAGGPARSGPVADQPRSRGLLAGSPEPWVHPHLHCLLLVAPSYWGANYVRKTRWAQEWATAMRLDYQPVVDVRRAHGGVAKAGATPVGLGSALEAVKYASKAADLVALGDALPEFVRQLRGARLIATSRALGEFVRSADLSTEEIASEIDPNAPHFHPTVEAVARWDSVIADYVLHPR
jgi:hypothetical protein